MKIEALLRVRGKKLFSARRRCCCEGFVHVGRRHESEAVLVPSNLAKSF